jgi:hypothetical protein
MQVSKRDSPSLDIVFSIKVHVLGDVLSVGIRQKKHSLLCKYVCFRENPGLMMISYSIALYTHTVRLLTKNNEAKPALVTSGAVVVLIGFLVLYTEYIQPARLSLALYCFHAQFDLMRAVQLCAREREPNATPRHEEDKVNNKFQF